MAPWPHNRRLTLDGPGELFAGFPLIHVLPKGLPIAIALRLVPPAAKNRGETTCQRGAQNSSERKLANACGQEEEARNRSSGGAANSPTPLALACGGRMFVHSRPSRPAAKPRYRPTEMMGID